MSTSQYNFTTKWQVESGMKDVFDIISNTNTLSTWWPSVYLDVRVTEEGNAEGIGKKFLVYTKGFLPYTMIWQMKVKEVAAPYHIIIEADGDFSGYGKWTFNEVNNECHINFDWSIEAKKPLLRYLSFLLKPLFSYNHLWAMQRGYEGLNIELQKINGITTGEPRRPTFPHNNTNNKNVLNQVMNTGGGLYLSDVE